MLGKASSCAKSFSLTSDLSIGTFSSVIGKQLVPTPMMEWSSRTRGDEAAVV